VWTPYAELYHHESGSGASKGHQESHEGQARFSTEREFVKDKWKHVLEHGDPYYNPNLTVDKLDFSIRN